MTNFIIFLTVIIVTASVIQTVLALAVLRLSQVHEMKLIEMYDISESTARKTEELLGATASIHELTNSNLTAVKSDLAAALIQIRSLQELVANLSGQKVDTTLDPAISRVTRMSGR